MGKECITQAVGYFATDTFPFYGYETRSECIATKNTMNSALLHFYRRNGLRIPDRPYTKYSVTRTTPPIIVKDLVKEEETVRGLYTGLTGMNYLFPNATRISNDSYVAKARAKATKKYYSQADALDANLLVSAGEAPKTYQHLASTAKRLAGALRSLKKLDVSGAFDALGIPLGGKHARRMNRKANRARNDKISDTAGFVSDSWLELKYGWMPLISDAYAMAEIYSERMGRVHDDIVIDVRAKVTFDPPCLVDSSGAIGVVHQRNGVAKHSIIGRYQLISPEMRQLSALGLLNPGSLVYELIPYSFVFDWFIPLGSYIDSLTSLAGLRFIGGCETSQLIQTGAASLYGWEQWNGERTMTNNEKLDSYEIQRTVLTDDPDRLLILSAKDIASFMNVDKLMTSLALLNSLRR